jgi:type II secretory ATPase GspE/PulE/Tfp pilus assembly ATPase PilB-like protein
MGLDAFSFSDALLGVLAQRLVKTLCPLCKEPYIGSRAQYDEIRDAYGAEAFDRDIGMEYGPDFRLCRSVGCETCSQKGYKGRAGVHELLVADDDVRKAITRRGSVSELRALAVQGGMTTLLQDGIKKVLLGLTDLKQVLAVCSR